jgi:hypothetical protein
MREVVLGRSAQIWQAIAREPGVPERIRHAIGHAELAQFEFTPQDRVWVFAYSRLPEDNRLMLARLRDAGVAEVVYITSSSTIITSLTSCYEYPRAKQQAEDEARALPQGKVLVLGLVVGDETELPAGRNAAVTIAEIARSMLAPDWPLAQGRRKALLRLVDRPFGSALERTLHTLYGRLMTMSGRHPCLLRPLDFALRALGMRWYGYTYLSNLLWSRSMTS